MKTSYYKFCYWLGNKLGIRRMEVWAYLNWFSISATDDIFAFFRFSDDYFKFCERWGIKANCGVGKVKWETTEDNKENGIPQD